MIDCKNGSIYGQYCKLSEFCVLYQEIVVNKDPDVHISDMESSECPPNLIKEARQTRQSETIIKN